MAESMTAEQCVAMALMTAEKLRLVEAEHHLTMFRRWFQAGDYGGRSLEQMGRIVDFARKAEATFENALSKNLV